jgi:hypothetical protein
MWGKDLAYYQERAEAERELAAASENEDVAAIHEEFARRYEALMEQPVLRPILRLAIPSESSARADIGVLHEKPAATQLGAGSAPGGTRPPQDSD